VKKLSKLTSALLALLMIMSLFAACGKDDDKDEKDRKDSETEQVNIDIVEDTTEPASENSIIDNTIKVENTTNFSDTTRTHDTTKVPDTTKATVTTKAPNTTKVPDTTKAPVTTAAPTTKPDTTEKEEPKPTNKDLLIGTWETTVLSDGLPVALQFVFKTNGTVQVVFTKASYEKMIKKAVENEISQYTDEEIAELGFADRGEAEEYLYELLEQEASYDDLKNMLETTGTWQLSGDTLTVTIEGEPATAKINLAEGKTSFVIKDSSGESMTFNKI